MTSVTRFSPPTTDGAGGRLDGSWWWKSDLKNAELDNIVVNSAKTIVLFEYIV